MSTYRRHNLGPLLREGWLTMTWRARLFDDEGGSRGCLWEAVRPELAQDAGLRARFVEVAQAGVAGLRPALEAGSRAAAPGQAEAWIAHDEPDARPLGALLGALSGGGLGIALWVADAAAEALQGLHARGWHHGALTPDALLLGSAGQLWVDGAAAAIAGRERLGQHAARAAWAREAAGWLAPEVAQGASGEPSDVYFVGALLHRLLTGQAHPQEWEPRWSMLMASVHQAGVEGHALAPTVQLLHRTLAERPEQRVELARLREALADAGLYGARGRLQAAALARLPPLAPAETMETTSDAPSAAGPRRAPDEPTRLVPQAAHSLPVALREKIGPHPLEILARSRYEIIEELGVGGMGTVYQARDRELDQVVALKVLHHDMLARPSTLERFRRELRLTRELNHPHIVPAYHLECFEGLYLYSMKYVRGPTLRALIRNQGALAPGAAASFMRCIGDALERTHSVGVVHRDIKSANLMLERRDGEPDHPYLMDFGIAVDRSLPALTRTGQQLGTPQYMSPEQARGEPVGPAADIYSFAVVFYEALTGQTPFAGETAVAVYTAQVREDYAPPGSLAPAVPDALDALLRRCLSADPGARPAQMSELLAALDALPALTPEGEEP
jgi:serine/threonine protein kinase